MSVDEKTIVESLLGLIDRNMPSAGERVEYQHAKSWLKAARTQQAGGDEGVWVKEPGLHKYSRQPTASAPQQAIGSAQVQDTYSAEPIRQPAQDVADAIARVLDPNAFLEKKAGATHYIKNPSLLFKLRRQKALKKAKAILTATSRASVPDAQGVNERLLGVLRILHQDITRADGNVLSILSRETVEEAQKAIAEAELAMQKGGE